MLSKIETLDARLLRALERLAFTKRQVNKVHVWKGFLSTKFVYFILDIILSVFAFDKYHAIMNFYDMVFRIL